MMTQFTDTNTKSQCIQSQPWFQILLCNFIQVHSYIFFFFKSMSNIPLPQHQTQ